MHHNGDIGRRVAGRARAHALAADGDAAQRESAVGIGVPGVERADRDQCVRDRTIVGGVEHAADNVAEVLDAAAVGVIAAAALSQYEYECERKHFHGAILSSRGWERLKTV